MIRNYYYEYTTLDELRRSGEGAQLVINSATADTLLLSLIREVSADISGMCNRKFAPRRATQHYDTRGPNAWSMSDLYYAGGRAGDVFQSKTGGSSYGRALHFDDDALEVTTLTNGDGTVITAAQYLLYPANVYPKEELRLVQSSGLAWQPDSQGNSEQVISLAGVFGYHDDYDAAWNDGGTVADVAGITAAATTYTASTGANLTAGMLLRIDSEFLYVSAASGSTLTVARGVNGSTAAIHATGAAVDVWQPAYTVARITRAAAAAHYNLRANPQGSTTSINGVTFNTPKDITQWLDHETEAAGLQRMGLG